MKIKNVNLTYYAFIYDWNGKCLEWINVLGDRYKEHLVKALKTKTEEVRIKNRDELKADIVAHGGTVAGSVSSKTSYLINNDINSTSSKNQKAKSLNVPIITEEEFLKKFFEK